MSDSENKPTMTSLASTFSSGTVTPLAVISNKD